MARDLEIANRLRAAGLKVVEVDGWQTRGSAVFSPRGGVDHHTAGSNIGNAPSLRVCVVGRKDLPGPLCNVLQGFDGTAYVIASGRANHAGPGSWKGLIGNSSVYGVERENDGVSPQRPDQQRLAEVLWAALLGDIDADLLCGHKEWAPNRKVDFHDVNYGLMRSNVARLQNPPPPEIPDLSHGKKKMFCLVQPPNRGVYRFNGSGMIGVKDQETLGGDRMVLAALGLRNDVLHVTSEWFDTWPILKE